MTRTELLFSPDGIMADGTVRVERVLLGRLQSAGLSRGTVALLLRAYVLGRSTTAHRILSEAAGAEIGITVQSPFRVDGMPERAWCDQPFASATVELVPGLGWREGALYDVAGSIPATVAEAAIGRPIGDVLTHPDIDPTSIITPTRDETATLQITPEIITIPIPRSLSERLGVLRLRLARRRAEKTTPAKVRYSFLGAATLAICSHAIGIVWKTHGLIPGFISGMSFSVMVITVTMAVDANMGRLITERLFNLRGAKTLGEETARRNHVRHLWEEKLRRGFDDLGHRLT